MDGCCHGSGWQLALSLGLLMEQNQVEPHTMSQSLLLSECEQQGLQSAELDLLAMLPRLTKSLTQQSIKQSSYTRTRSAESFYKAELTDHKYGKGRKGGIGGDMLMGGSSNFWKQP